MNISNNQFLSIEQLQEQYLKQQKKIQPVKTSGGFSFEEILQKQQTGEIKFSKLERLSDGTRKAGEKGIRESLVLVDELAFIVNTGSNTVITAMDQAETKENIFTNIDGAVII